ncbi:MAG: hypothetical protein NZ550_00195, partial [Fimbriimonadales bacterium]|nr:hypothetical protein [Fimbriimonadales bacterium]
MELLLPHIWDWFRQKQDYFEVFAAADSRLEGWFKAELLMLLTQLTKQGVIEGFEREANIPTPASGKRAQVDFRIFAHGQEHLCEMKALCISRAAGTPRSLQFYFRDDGLGLLKDFRKLNALGHPSKWVLAFVYPAPQPIEWNHVVEALPNDL